MATKKKTAQRAPQQMTVLSQSGVTVETSSLVAEPPLVDLRIPTPAPITDGTTMLERVKALVVTDASGYTKVAEVRRAAIARMEEVEKTRVDMKAPSLEAGRRVDAFFKPVLDAFKEASLIATQKLLEYDRKQQQIAEQKQREADERARKEREAKEAEARAERERAAEQQRQREREAAAKKAEEDRIAREAAEAKAREEQARRQAAEAAAAGDRAKAEEAQKAAAAERAKALEARKAQIRAEREREAAEAETRRLQQEAEARASQLDQQAATVVAEQIKTEEVEVAGLSRPKVWKWKLKDKAKLKEQFLLVDEKSINRIVAAMKERAHDIVGAGAIEIYQDSNIRQG